MGPRCLLSSPMSDSTTTDAVLTEVRGRVLLITLNRPDARNALTPELIRGIGGAILDGETDAEIRVLLLTGTGDRAFCAGMDLSVEARSKAATRSSAISTVNALSSSGRSRVSVRIPSSTA